MSIKDLKVRVRRRARTAGVRPPARVVFPAVVVLLFAAAALWHTPAASAGADTDLTKAERQVIELINKERTDRGLPALKIRRSLNRAAWRHSRDMLRRDYFSHTNPGGRTLGTRCRRAGYGTTGCRSWRVGENIAWGTSYYRTPEMVVAMWMRSRSHRRIILSPGFWDIGVGRCRGVYRGRRGVIMTTADFGRRIRSMDNVAGAPEVSDATLSRTELTRRDNDSRRGTRITYSVNEPVRTRVTIRWADGSWARTVSGWRWMPKGTRWVDWDGKVVFKGEKIPAPDGEYKVRVHLKDLSGVRRYREWTVTCASEAGDEATFVTVADRNFRVRRGRRAVFRFKALYLPSLGQEMPYATARLVLKIRDSRYRSRGTKVIEDVPLNTTQRYVMRYCNLRPGHYTYYLLAKLPDGTRQQMVADGRFVIRYRNGRSPRDTPSKIWRTCRRTRLR